MIAVIMMQDQLHVATVDELHIEALKKKVKKSIVWCCKRPVFGAFIYLTCFAYDLFFFFFKQSRLGLSSSLAVFKSRQPF